MILDSPNPIIKELIEKKELTQARVAYDLGISYPYFNQIANGLRRPSKELEQRIEDYIEDLGQD